MRILSNLNRLAKLEKVTNDHRHQKKLRPLRDYSELSDEELKNLFEREVDKLMIEPNPYEGMTDQQLSDLYMEQIKAGNRKNTKKLK